MQRPRHTHGSASEKIRRLSSEINFSDYNAPWNYPSVISDFMLRHICIYVYVYMNVFTFDFIQLT